MNEPLPPPLPGSAPPPTPPEPYRPPRSPVAEKNPKGSLLKGLVLGWVVVVGGYLVLGAIAAGLGSLGAFDSSNSAGEMLLVLLGAAPWLGLIAWLVYYAAQGETRTAAGFALAIASMVAVAVLLVAACFALLSGANFH